MKVFHYSLTILFFLIRTTIFAQSPEWQWAKTAIGSSYYLGFGAVSLDDQDNVYIVGSFTSDTIIFGRDTLINTGSYNIFIAKYNSSGDLIWAKKAGGTGMDLGYDIKAQANGMIYISGSFTSTAAVFNNDTLHNTTGTANMFIAKYDSAGNVIWVRGSVGLNAPGRGISTDANGNAYVTGNCGSSTIIFGTDTLTNTGLANIFTVKYDPSGNVIWAKSAGGTQSIYGYGVSADANGYAYITGIYSGSFVVFGADTLLNRGQGNVYVVKYDASGNVIWARSAGQQGLISAYSISADLQGNAYVTGWYSEDSVVFGTQVLPRPLANAYFLAKYDSSGNVIWAQGGGAVNDFGRKVSTDAYNNAYVVGSFQSDTFILGGDTLFNNGQVNIFVVKYEPSGNVSWVKRAGGIDDDLGYGLCPDASGNVFVTGTLNSPTIAFDSDTLVGIGSENVFVAKLASTAKTGIPTLYQSPDFSIYPNPSRGNIYISGLTASSDIEVYNIIGEKVYSTQTNFTDYIIDLGDQAKGVYICKVSDIEGNIKQRMVILE